MIRLISLTFLLAITAQGFSKKTKIRWLAKKERSSATHSRSGWRRDGGHGGAGKSRCESNGT